MIKRVWNWFKPNSYVTKKYRIVLHMSNGMVFTTEAKTSPEWLLEQIASYQWIDAMVEGVRVNLRTSDISSYTMEELEDD